MQYKSGLSKVGKLSCLCMLYREDEIYEDLLRRATNLRASEKEMTLAIMHYQCGIQPEMELFHGRTGQKLIAERKR